MIDFKKYCEQRDQELEEGLGKWVGQGIDTAAGAAGKTLGRMGNAAISGIGHGVTQGAKRGWQALTQGQGSNQTHNWGMMAQKAVSSGNPDEFVRVAKIIYHQMKQTQAPSQGSVMSPQKTAGGNVGKNTGFAQKVPV